MTDFFMPNPNNQRATRTGASGDTNAAHNNAHGFKNKRIATLGFIALIGGGWAVWHWTGIGHDDTVFVSSNGRIEATEVDIATRLPGRINDILVEEGAFVTAGQVLATMQVQTLEAQWREASAQAQVVMRQNCRSPGIGQ